MKKPVALLLSAALLVSLTACGLSDLASRIPGLGSGREPEGESSSVSAPAPAVSAPEPAPVLPDEPGLLVTDGYQLSGVTEYGGRAEFHLPEIQLDGPEIAALNQEIRDVILAQSEPTYTAGDGKTYMAFAGDYRWYVNDDVLSVIVRCDYLDWEWTDLYVYNVSISRRARLSDDEVIAAAGFADRAEYLERTRAAMGAFYRDRILGAGGRLEGADMVGVFNEQLDKTIDPGNVAEARPFLGAEGELCVAANIYSIAGADYYAEVVGVSRSGTEPGYDQHLTAAAPGPFSDEILCRLAILWYADGGDASHLLARVDGTEGDEATIQIYEDAGDHTATLDWLTVDRTTGRGDSMFQGPDSVDLTYYLD